MTLRVLDLFSGIGGFSLGLERTSGFKTVAFCEIDPFCRKVLAKHWPEVPCYDDVRTLTAERLRTDGVSVDVICGGFPCQDVSTAGERCGIHAGRSGLWSEIAHLVSEIRPKLVLVENVTGLLSLGMGRVLGDLAQIRYDAEWECLPSASFGGPTARDRVFIVAYPCGHGLETDDLFSLLREQASDAWDDGYSAAENRARNWRRELPNAAGPVGVVHRVPNAVDRIKSLGNSIDPKISQAIGNAILASLKQAEAA